MTNLISQEVIESFLNGEDPEMYIVGIEYDYKTNRIYKIIQDPEKGKIIKTDKFTPFLWCADITGLNFYNNSKAEQKLKMQEYGILSQKLRTDGNEKLENGLPYMVKSLKGYSELISFFRQGGLDPWGEKTKKYFQVLSPAEQYLVQTKKRLFKGIDEYSDIHKVVFDIETTGLDPETNEIILIGIKDNKGFQQVISAFGIDGEKNCIQDFFAYLKVIKPTIIGGYNSASFDFPFIMRRAEILGLDVKKLTKIISEEHSIKVKEGTLKLASEVEPYNQYVLWGMNIIDISHSVRRAMAINSDIKSWGLKYVTKFIEKEKTNRVYVDGAYISKIYLENEEYYMNPKTGNYKKVGEQGTEDLETKYPGKFEKWSGQKIVEQYLDDDLYETMVVDESFSQSTFLLSKLVPTTYERISTIGTASLWKLIMLAWSYDYGLAIPEKGEKRQFTGGLSRLLNVGYAKNIVKFDFSSLYPSIQLVYDVFPESDITGAQKSMLKYFRDIRIKYKLLAEENKKTNPALSEAYSRKQLPLKIFINGYFGSLSSPIIYPWGDVDKGEMVTCTGRQCLRMMLMFFVNRGYKPLVLDTDGVNFEAPEDVESRQYIGKGLNEMVKNGETYNGVKADVAEFNDIFMRNEMGLDIDYFAPACINISRKNYIIKKLNGKIKLTGNTIKSKKLQQYVVDFFDKGFPMLLDGDGVSFIELYYAYLTKIYNKEIPLTKIASKSKVKMTVQDYIKHGKLKTKAGNSMAKQAHMELILQNNYQPTLGETIYYINNGNKKGDGDVQKKTKPLHTFETKEEKRDYIAQHGKIPEIDDGVAINCYMISEKDIMNNPDILGDYNVPRYIAKFNKQVEALLAVFNPEIRNEIIIDNPEKRQFFTQKQCELVNGMPIEETDQDNLEDVLTLSDSEMLFWNKIGIDPFYMYIDDSITRVDQYWVDLNRKVLTLEVESIKTIEDSDDIIEKNGHDFADHIIIETPND